MQRRKNPVTLTKRSEMTDFNRKDHWENIYSTKELHEVSWYQPVPETSLQFLSEAGLEKDAKIVDVGGGDSFLVDHLLEAGYTDITIVDISEKALERAKKRLGTKAGLVTWIVSDITALELNEPVDFWHDRAVFHFLTQAPDIEKYSMVLNRYIRKDGTLVIGTFSENGPAKCSGIEIKQYSGQSLEDQFKLNFEKIKCLETEHPTPFHTTQHFVFCSFKKKEA